MSTSPSEFFTAYILLPYTVKSVHFKTFFPSAKVIKFSFFTILFWLYIEVYRTYFVTAYFATPFSVWKCLSLQRFHIIYDLQLWQCYLGVLNLSLRLFNSKLWRHEVGRQLVGGDKFRINCISVTMHCCCLQPLINQCGFVVSICVHLTGIGPGFTRALAFGWSPLVQKKFGYTCSGHSVRQREGRQVVQSDVINNRRLVLEQVLHAFHVGLPAQPCEVETDHSAHQTKPGPCFSHTE